MMKSLLAVLVLVIFSLATANAASAGRRVALVVGQSNYKSLASLSNPANDARHMAKVLGEHGFEVLSCDGAAPGCFDLTRAGMLRALNALEVAADGADLALVFYAGHGMEGDIGNILAPTDAAVDCATLQIAKGVLIEQFILAASPARHKVVILDACRDNPLGQICPPVEGRAPASLSFKDIKVPDARDFLLVTSTKPGQQALDGPPDAHSPFAKALFAELQKRPEIYFDQLFNQVAKAVIEATKDSQATQLPETIVRGGAPETCLRGERCAADPRAAALAAEVETLRAARSRDQDLLSTAAAQEILERAVASRALSDQGQVKAVVSLLGRGSRLDGKDLAGIYLGAGDYGAGSFVGTDLRGADLNAVKSARTNFASVSFSWATLQSGDFTESQFEKAFIGFAVAERAKFKGIRGRDSQWVGSDLKGADFSGADLRLANFQFADLTGANFRNAKLNGAFLVGSILTGADFTGAELEDTDFTAASIDARQLSKEQLKGVCRTRLKIDGAKSEYFYVRLKSFIKSTRFASGLAFRDEYLQAHVDLPQDHPGLPVCRHRIEIPTHRLPIAFVVEPQELRNSLDMSIAGEILDSGGRRRLFSDRARRHMELIRSHILQARFLSILPVERMSLADLRASSGRLDISAFDSTGAELILPLLKIRDLPDRRGQQNLVTLGTKIAASEAERWKNLQERLRTRQEFEQRHRSERRHAAMPISWDAALSRGKEAKGAFIEALMTTRVPLGSLLPDEACVSESNLFCHIEFFVFDPEKSAGRAPEIVALAGADRLSQLLDGMLAALPKTLPLEVRAEIKAIEPQRRTLIPKYGSEVLEPRSTMRLGAADVKVYSMGSFSGFLRSSTRARRRALPARISARLQSGDEGIRNLASTIARFDGWKCYEHLGLNRALAWDRIIIPERALESALLAHRKSGGELSATLDLTDIRIVADSVMGATYRGQDCLLVGSIRSMAVGDRDGNRLFEIDPASLAIAK